MTIITHDGLFHADEVFAIALIHRFIGHCPVVRTRRIATSDLTNPEMWVLDQGGKYEPELNNFDHHQDKTLPATNMLVLNELVKRNVVSKDMMDMLKNGFQTISAIDTGGYDSFPGFQVNALIKSFNSLEGGWGHAYMLATHWIEAQYQTLNKIPESLSTWRNSKVLSPGVRYAEKYPMFWKSYNEEPLLIVRKSKSLHENTEEFIYELHSANSKEMPILPGHNELFLNAGSFIAGYQNLDDALSAAKASFASFYSLKTLSL